MCTLLFWKVELQSRPLDRDLPPNGSFPEKLQGPGQSQEPGASSWSYTRVQGPKYLEHFLLPSQTVQQGAGRELEHLGYEPVPTWDIGVPGGGLTGYAKAGPRLLFLQIIFERVNKPSHQITIES